ncbi:MAG: DUF1573 domain-containing protein [Lewinellaceae bacterium]|nr:DUF1573 domain-containing protein [Lewinellaceae bacterium]
MRHLLCFSACIAILFCGVRLQAQDLQPALRKMSNEQKLELLAYMRTQGVGIDREIQSQFEQLSPDAKQKTQLYVDLLAKATGDLQRTEIMWSHDTIAFGKVEEGTFVMDSFIVKNTGTQPYLINRAQSSCDCTVLSFPRFPVMPGESATVRVEFDSTNKIGKVRAGIVLYDNSAPNRRSVLYIDGNITAKKGE